MKKNTAEDETYSIGLVVCWTFGIFDSFCLQYVKKYMNDLLFFCYYCNLLKYLTN